MRPGRESKARRRAGREGERAGQKAPLHSRAQPRDVNAILRDTAETLRTAELGLADLLSDDPGRRLPGLRNVVVFGHATTQALQNLRSVVRDEFDAWYEPKREAMRADELLRYFWNLRSVVLKEGTLGQVSSSLYIEHMDTADLEPLTANPPAGAKAFFMGDNLGGSGWEVELSDGTTAKYYVALPEAVKAEFKLHLPDSPATHLGESLDDTSAGALAQRYIEYLRQLVAEASQRFAH